MGWDWSNKHLKDLLNQETWEEIVWDGCEKSELHDIECYGRLFRGNVPIKIWRNRNADKASEHYKLNATNWHDLWHYSVSNGANNDLSHSGLTHSADLEEAKKYCEYFANVAKFSCRAIEGKFIYPEQKIILQRN